MKQWFRTNSKALRWLAIATAVKLVMFVFFAVQLNQNRPAKYITNNVFYEASDTRGYYAPVEAFVNGEGYNSICRMPGLLPLYAPLYWIFGASWGKTLIILLQFLISVISVYVLALTAGKILKSQQAFIITFWVYLLSSFVSIWDHYGLSDSFGISFLIFSVYFSLRYKETLLVKHLLYAGLFAAWSVFFRQVHLVALPFIAFLFFERSKVWKWFTRQIIIFGLPLALTLGIWLSYAYHRTGKWIAMVGGQTECFKGLPEELISLRKLVIAWGGDIQPWSKGSYGEWFFAGGERSRTNAPFESSVYTSVFTIDSLLQLKKEYDGLSSGRYGLKRDSVIVRFKQKIDRYYFNYKSEHPMRFYLLNRTKHFVGLMFPSRLDDLPFPAQAKMTFYHKAIKGVYFLLLYVVTVLSVIGAVILLIRRNLFPFIPFSIIFVLTFIMGYTEQRYLAAAYPFMAILAAYVLYLAKKRVWKK